MFVPITRQCGDGASTLLPDPDRGGDGAPPLVVGVPITFRGGDESPPLPPLVPITYR